LDIPSIREIRRALQDIPGATKFDPKPEDIAEGTGPATEVARLDQDAKWSASEQPLDGAQETDDVESTDAPVCIFEVPPELTDADVQGKLGLEVGRLKRLEQIRGTDAYGWYVTFHQNAFQYGVHIPAEGVATLALGALDNLGLSIKRKLEITFHAVLRHELFHFAVDCMVANWELTLGIPVYWTGKTRLRNAAGYIELEEALANAYMLRGLRYPVRILADSRGALQAMIDFCVRQPSGYSEGPLLAISRNSYATGCRKLSASFQDARVLPDGLDTLIFYPDIIRIDWRRCPIIVHDRLGLLESLGIGISLFDAIPTIVESPTFVRGLRKLDTRIQRKWQRRKDDLARCVQLKGNGFQQWERGGSDCYSVNVDGNYRVHLRRDRESDTWIAESIGDHKSMGHG
jgi:hypothetical protein